MLSQNHPDWEKVYLEDKNILIKSLHCKVGFYFERCDLPGRLDEMKSYTVCCVMRNVGAIALELYPYNVQTAYNLKLTTSILTVLF